jgi:hypothetical protein
MADVYSSDSLADVEQEPPEEFTLFPKLPIELRLKIWKAALPGPRVIEFSHTSFFRRLTLIKDSQNSLLNLSNSCKEAYDVVKKDYRSVSLQVFDLDKKKTPDAALLINYSLDTIYLGLYSEKVLEILDSKVFTDLKLIERLALSCGLWSNGFLSKQTGFLFRRLTKLESLKEIVLDIGDSLWCSDKIATIQTNHHITSGLIPRSPVHDLVRTLQHEVSFFNFFSPNRKLNIKASYASFVDKRDCSGKCFHQSNRHY